MYYLETSAKEAENVERLFMEIAAELMEVSTSCITKVSSMNECLLIYCILNTNLSVKLFGIGIFMNKFLFYVIRCGR